MGFLERLKAAPTAATASDGATKPALAVVQRSEALQKTEASPNRDAAPWKTPPFNGSANEANNAVAWVNAQHFIAHINGKPVICCEAIDAATGYPRLALLARHEFNLKLEPYSVTVAVAGGAVNKPLSAMWLRSPIRREYLGGMALAPHGGKELPHVYYLFKGWATKPEAGDASPMVDHIRTICCGDGPVFEYLLNWLAYLVQNPGKRPEVCVVMPGPEGAGKGTVARVMRRIFGAHFLHLSNTKHLTGAFNGHLMNAMFVFVDEAFWSGDRGAEGVLKALVTEDEFMVEPKGQQAFQMPNHMAFFMATNNDYAAPASANARRWFVVPAPSTLVGNHAYFTQLHAWIEADGAAKFLHYLLHRDLAGFNPRQVPHTQGLNAQKVLHMAALDRWVLNALESGTSLAGGEWCDPCTVPCDAALQGFAEYCKQGGLRHYGTDTRTIGRRLDAIFQCGPANSRTGNQYDRRRAWRLPALDDSRRLAAQAFGLHDYEWGQT